MKKILAVAVHPDDETLGCGGSLLRHKAEGDKIYWLIITNISEEGGYSPDQVEKRQKEIDRVAGFCGFDEVFKLDFPTTELDQIPTVQLLTGINNVINKIRPEILYIPFHSDVHTDHQITFKALMSCTKNFRYPFIRRILMYETLSETEFAPPLPKYAFLPNVFVDITDFFERKCESMLLYQGEVMAAPYPRSLEAIEALAKYRGSRIGVKYTEAFMLLLDIY